MARHLGHSVGRTSVINRFRHQAGEGTIGKSLARSVVKAARLSRLEIWIRPIVNFDSGRLVGSNKHIRVESVSLLSPAHAEHLAERK